MNMGKRIYRQRIAKGLTMEQLANQLGVGKSAVNKWEKGYVQNIKRSTIEKMAQIFGCDPVWLMGLNNDVDYSVKVSENELLLIEHFRKSDDATQAVIKKLLEIKEEKGK